MKIPDCGVVVANGRIVGGQEVSPYSIPWQVAIVGPGNYRPLCGGTLISSKHVLSAAHCFDKTQRGYINKFEVIVGEHRAHSLNDGDGTRHEVCHHEAHPEYRWEFKELKTDRSAEPTEIMGYFNDFQMIKLKNPVKIGIRAVPACLPPQGMANDIRDGDLVTVSGWGALKHGDPTLPDVLYSVDVPFITKESCREKSYITSQLHRIGALTESMLCAGHAEGGIDACQGDSGGKSEFTLK